MPYKPLLGISYTFDVSQAIKNNDIAAIDQLIKGRLSADRMAALNLACKAAHSEIAVHLIDKGVKGFPAKDLKGVLSDAIENRLPAVVQALVRNNAFHPSRDSLATALLSGQSEIVEILAPRVDRDKSIRELVDDPDGLYHVPRSDRIGYVDQLANHFTKEEIQRHVEAFGSRAMPLTYARQLAAQREESARSLQPPKSKSRPRSRS